jgi:hypothetical protein
MDELQMKIAVGETLNTPTPPTTSTPTTSTPSTPTSPTQKNPGILTGLGSLWGSKPQDSAAGAEPPGTPSFDGGWLAWHGPSIAKALKDPDVVDTFNTVNSVMGGLPSAGGKRLDFHADPAGAITSAAAMIKERVKQLQDTHGDALRQFTGDPNASLLDKNNKYNVDLLKNLPGQAKGHYDNAMKQINTFRNSSMGQTLQNEMNPWLQQNGQGNLFSQNGMPNFAALSRMGEFGEHYLQKNFGFGLDTAGRIGTNVMNFVQHPLTQGVLGIGRQIYQTAYPMFQNAYNGFQGWYNSFNNSTNGQPNATGTNTTLSNNRPRVNVFDDPFKLPQARV